MSFKTGQRTDWLIQMADPKRNHSEQLSDFRLVF